MSPDGKTLALSDGGDASGLWDIATGNKLATLQASRIDRPLDRLAFSPDGKTVAVSEKTRGFMPSGPHTPQPRHWSVRTLDATTGKELHNLGDMFNSVGSLGFSPDGATLIFSDGQLHIWDTAKKKEKAVLADTSGDFLFFDDDGSSFALSTMRDWKGRISGVGLWNAATGKQSRVLPVHPDYRLTARAPNDKIVRLCPRTVEMPQPNSVTWPRARSLRFLTAIADLARTSHFQPTAITL